MTIAELLPVRTRKGVSWYADDPPEEARLALEARGYLVRSCTARELQSPAFLVGLSAVVFSQSETKRLKIQRDLSDHAEAILDYGCHVIVRPVRYGQPLVAATLRQAQLPVAGLTDGSPSDSVLPHVRVFDIGATWQDIANYIADHPIDKPPPPKQQVRLDAVDTHGHGVRLAADEELLLRRAFDDCASVHLIRNDSGRSGAKVYCAFPEIANGRAAYWPVPYFVKIGPRNRIFTEHFNYEHSVYPFVPFHLGPRLDSKRCCLGARKGILIGDYVTESESLIDCARGGRGSSAIACLFDRTLQGWHRYSREENKVLGEYNALRCPTKISSARMQRARELGAQRELRHLRAVVNQYHAMPTLTGFVHGDLHGQNVRVRASDAILIDFAAHCEAPLVWDAACLEASLVIEGFSVEAGGGDLVSWLQSIEDLYEQTDLGVALVESAPRLPSAWFRACVRQIRLYARRMERARAQYAVALAVALLKKACKDPQMDEPGASIRAAAYVLAERLLSRLDGTR